MKETMDRAILDENGKPVVCENFVEAREGHQRALKLAYEALNDENPQSSKR